MKRTLTTLPALALLIILHFTGPRPACAAGAAGAAPAAEVPPALTREELARGFANPPAEARPRVYWWWLNSNATRESITRDLEELKAKGFAGVNLFDAGSSDYNDTNRAPAGPVFGSPAWIELFVYALKEADRLGLEVTTNICSGWNPGGPPVTADDALKHLVYTETPAAGPARFSAVLPAPRGAGYHDVAVQAYRVRAGGPGSGSSAAPAALDHWQEKTLTRTFGGVGTGVGASGNIDFLYRRESADPATADVEPGTLTDLTSKLDQDGRLTWDVPAGQWKIVRYGYAPLPSARVSTASAGWGGYSFDHLDSGAIGRYLSTVVDPILQAAGPLAGRSLRYLYTDSWEMGSPNWTAGLAAQFRQRRGYDIAPFLPVLTGRVVGSRDLSDRFLFDFRQTIGDLIAERFYAFFGAYARAHGLDIHCEAGGPHGHPVDALRALGLNAYPQGEFWPRSSTHRVTEAQRYFVKQQAAAAHIYGKTWVAAEGPTTVGPQWERPPRDLKDAFDKAFCEGLNRLFWHTFTSSPAEFGKPGLEYFAGTHLNPNATWWAQAGAVTGYLARCSWMLSRGRFVADACVYIGDDVPVFGSQKHEVEGLGAGFDTDDVNAEVILTRMSVRDGMITLPDGMQYRLLILPDREAITAGVLRKVAELARAGATVVGPRPVTSTGLVGYPASEAEVKKLAGELWGAIDGKTVTENRVGRGRVVWGKAPRQILAAQGVGPDFEFKSALPDTWLDYIHRQAGDVEVYYVINRLGWHDAHDTAYRYRTDLPDRYEEVDASFRVSGAAPELWDPLTGKITELAVWREAGGRTVVPLRLAPYGSAFVVFRKGPAREHIVEVAKDGKTLFPVSERKPGAWPAVRLVAREGKIVAGYFEGGSYFYKNASGKADGLKLEFADLSCTLDGPWSVAFAPGLGAPEGPVTFEKLISWTDSPVEGIKYFSGSATYRKTFDFPVSALPTPGSALYLDLGNVLELAEVTLNGKNLGVVWIAPYRLDVAGAIKGGENTLEVKVVNMWPNRLIGDAAKPAAERLTKTNVKKFKLTGPLRKSGLLGPVRLVPAGEVEVKF